MGATCSRCPEKLLPVEKRVASMLSVFHSTTTEDVENNLECPPALIV